MTAKEFWIEKELEVASIDQIENILPDMEDEFKLMEEYAILFAIEQLKDFKDQVFVNQENPIGGIIADKISELKNQLTKNQNQTT